MALFGLLIIALVVGGALFAPWIAPFDPNEQMFDGLTLEGARPSARAIARSDWSVAKPRDISSRSDKLNDRGARVRGGGLMPPLPSSTEPTVFFDRDRASAIFQIGSPDR